MADLSKLGFKTKKTQSSSIQQITLQKGIFMGAQCVKSSSKDTMSNHYSRMDSLEHQLRNCEQNLMFSMTIEHLRLTNMTDKVKEIRFSLEEEFQIMYSLSEFTIQENLIKSDKIHKTQFQFPAKKLDSKVVKVEIIGFNNQTIEALNLKLAHLCTGPVHHDHLLKQLRARLMFDLHLYQNINLSAKCKDLKITLFQPKTFSLEDLSYKFTLTTENDDRTVQSNQGYLTNLLTFQAQQLSVSVPNNSLKQSNFRFEFSMSQFLDCDVDETVKVIHSIFIPYRKIQNFDTFTTLRKKQIDYVKKSIPFNDHLKLDGKIIGNICFIFEVQASILYAEQMECLIFSEIGVSSVSPTLSCQSNEGLINELKQIYKSVKKIKNSLPDQKSELIKNIDDIYIKFQKSNQEIFTCEEQLYERQLTLVKLLNQLSQFFAEGEDILNERLWRTINYIVHKPELSTRYLTLHQNLNTKKNVYLLYYKFIIAVISKVIVCTETGITFHELQCIQKFIAFAYFRFPWIQDKIIQALKRKQDPIITEEKLIEYGANAGCRSPSKSYVYDWEVNIYRKIENEKELKEMLAKLQEVSQKFQEWDVLIFSRNDEDLFYGLFLEIWTEAEISLSNLRGKILWEYFPNYGKLLSCFLGEMNNSKISDFSTLFRQCSNKLILNQKLLNTFVVQLFPKTYLFQISCVLKCLNLLQSYFEVLTKQNKKLPHDFHFDFFYTGVKSIFQQNHSYVVVKVLYILYKYYDIFTQEFKKILNNFLLEKIFFTLFLHWCTNVRQMFHHLILHKIIHKKASNPEEIPESHKLTRSHGSKIKQKSYPDELLINRRINIYLKQIKNYCMDFNKVTQDQQKIRKQSYHERMKSKLGQRIRRKTSERKTCEQDLSQSKVSEDIKSYSFMVRKKSLFTQNSELQFSRFRKMSVADQIYSPKIEEEYKQYCLISLKEYDEIKSKGESVMEVQKLAKLVQGDIDS